MKTLYWSREVGKFVNKMTGESVNLASSLLIGPAFTGTAREWYETLVETIIDCSSGMKNVALHVPNNILLILESTVLFKPNHDKNSDSTLVGTMCNRFKVYSDARVAKNEILIVNETERRRVIVNDMI